MRVEVQRVWTIDVCICFLLQTPPNTKCLKREKEGYEFNIGYKMEQKFLTDISLIINVTRTKNIPEDDKIISVDINWKFNALINKNSK